MLPNHTAYVLIEYDHVGHGECLDCTWQGPERHGNVAQIAQDCREHEEEYESDE